MDSFEAQLWTPLFSVSLVYLLLGRGVNNRSMLGRKRSFRTSGLVRHRQRGFYHSFMVLYDHFTYSRKFSSTDYKGARGRECLLIPRELSALTRKVAVSTCPINIVNRLQYCFLSLGAQNAGLVGKLYDILGRTMNQKTEGLSFRVFCLLQSNRLILVPSFTIC